MNFKHPKIRITYFLFIAFLFTCCSDQKEDLTSDLTGSDRKITIDNRNTQWFVDVGLPVEVKQYLIPKDITLRTGSFFTSYCPIGENLLLVDRYSSSLSCISDSGEILWSLIPPSPGIDKYGNLGSVDVDYQSEEIYVVDRLLLKIDVFNFKGAYLRSVEPPMAFFDFSVLGRDEFVYDVTGKYQKNINGSDSTQMRYLFHKGEHLKLASPLDAEFDLDAIPLNGFNRFCRVGDDLMHRMPFENVSYRIIDGDAYPLLELEFSVNSQFNKVALDKGINDNAGYIYKNEIPYPREVVFESQKERTYVVYAQGRRFYLTCDDQGNQIINPGRYYNFGGVVLPSPRSYKSGHFYLQIYRWHYDFLQKCLKGNMLTEKHMQAELQRLYDEFGDNDDILILSLKFG